MEIPKQVCTLEQAKRLKELGVQQNSKFFWYDNQVWFLNDVTDWGNQYTFSDERLGLADTYAAYSVAELGAMLPDGNSFGGDWYMRNCWKGVSFGYNRANSGQHHIMRDWFQQWAEALADLLIYLLENNFTTVEEVNKTL